MIFARLPTVDELSPLPVHYVYAAYDGDTIVYVGQTVDTESRWRAHNYNSPWFTPGMVFKVLSAHVDDYRTAELLAIKKHLPQFNKQGIPGFRP